VSGNLITCNEVTTWPPLSQNASIFSAGADPKLSPPLTPAEIFWRTCLGGGVNKFFTINIFFCESNPLAKFQDPTITHSGRKVSEQREKTAKLKISVIFNNVLKDVQHKEKENNAADLQGKYHIYQIAEIVLKPIRSTTVRKQPKAPKGKKSQISIFNWLYSTEAS
jgi:hypothetical protein